MGLEMYQAKLHKSTFITLIARMAIDWINLWRYNNLSGFLWTWSFPEIEPWWTEPVVLSPRPQQTFLKARKLQWTLVRGDSNLNLSRFKQDRKVVRFSKLQFIRSKSAIPRIHEHTEISGCNTRIIDIRRLVSCMTGRMLNSLSQKPVYEQTFGYMNNIFRHQAFFSLIFIFFFLSASR